MKTIEPAQIDLVIDNMFVVVAICAMLTRDTVEKALEVNVEPVCILHAFSSN